MYIYILVFVYCIMEKSKKKVGNFPKEFLYATHQVYVLITKHMEKRLKEERTVSFSQFWVLVCFIECRDQTKQIASEIAKLMYVTEATLSRHIAKLEKDRLIEKKRDKTNGRKYIITLTEKGKKQFLLSKKIIESELNQIFNVVSVSERKTVLKNFDKILEKLKVLNN